MKVSMKRTGVIIVLIVLLLTVAGCGGSTQKIEDVTLSISGSGTTTAILQGVEKNFAADVKGYRLNVLPGAGTGGGVQGVMERGLDVAAMARAPKDEEKEKGLEWTQFGMSASCVLAHRDVGVANLSSAQVKGIFTGEIKNWCEVGGANIKIVLLVRDEGDSSTVGIRQISGDMPFPDSAEVLISQEDMQKKVAETPGAVGYGSWAAAVATGANVIGLALDGTKPDDPAFPISGPVGIGYLTEQKGKVQPLIDWLLSQKGQQALQAVDVIIKI